MIISWEQLPSTPQGVPMLQGETILNHYQNISLTVPRLKIAQIGQLTLTSCRLVFSIFQSPVAYQLLIQNITQMKSSAHKEVAGFAYFSFNTTSGEEFSFQSISADAVDLSSKLSTMTTSTSSGSLPPNGSMGGRTVKKIIRKKQSEKELVGIAAVQNRVQEDIANQSSELKGALADIESLKESAQKLMKIAETLKEKGDPESKNDLGEVLVALGVSDPVMRETAGKSYANELARQFSTSIKPVLARTGGVLSVPEAYCLFNRALGTNYVSPNDLAEALEALKRREMGVKVDTIAGVTLVVLSEKTYQAVLADILSKFADDEFATPLLMSKRTQLPITVAQSYLLRAESEGILCRDDSMAGLRFYRNKFDKFEMIYF